MEVFNFGSISRLIIPGLGRLPVRDLAIPLSISNEQLTSFCSILCQTKQRRRCQSIEICKQWNETESLKRRLPKRIVRKRECEKMLKIHGTLTLWKVCNASLHLFAPQPSFAIIMHYIILHLPSSMLIICTTKEVVVYCTYNIFQLGKLKKTEP